MLGEFGRATLGTYTCPIVGVNIGERVAINLFLFLRHEIQSIQTSQKVQLYLWNFSVLPLLPLRATKSPPGLLLTGCLRLM
jgi:hypothetical protein